MVAFVFFLLFSFFAAFGCFLRVSVDVEVVRSAERRVGVP